MHCEEQSVCVWEDNTKVIFTYSIPDIVDQMTYCVRRGRDKATKKFEQYKVSQPLVAHFYNSIMGGVDTFDNFVYQSRRPIKAYRWYLAVGLQVMYWCIANTFIVKRSFLPGDQKKTVHFCNCQI